MFDFLFFFRSVMLGVGLAMDAFSVSLANGLHEPFMRRKKMCGVAAVFGVFQGMMPMIGWICVRTVAQRFQAFEKAVPWIALGLLLLIGGKMVVESLRGQDEEEPPRVGVWGLLVQGVATSIDALSVGFTIAAYKWYAALVAVSIVAAVTGISNARILENLEKLSAEFLGDIIIRIPIVPGYNTDENELRKMAEYLHKLRIKGIELLSYHAMGEHKWQAIGAPVQAYTAPSEMQIYRSFFKA
ncbi:MAG: manganese efflux pump [Clostridia bacterium]|nr:manganese efflux pump [Clostridia bacterium]